MKPALRAGALARAPWPAHPRVEKDTSSKTGYLSHVDSVESETRIGPKARLPNPQSFESVSPKPKEPDLTK